MGTCAPGGDHHGREFDGAFALLGDFEGTFDIAQRAKRIGAPHRNNVGPIALRFNAGCQLFQLNIGLGQRIAHLNLSIKQIQQQAVTVGQVVLGASANRVFQQRHTVQTQFRGHRRRLTNVVRLNRAGGD